MTTVVKVTITGSGFPSGKSIDISALPEFPSGQPQDYDLSQVTAGADGAFQTVLVMPSDIPDIAQARSIKIIAALSDGSGAASAEFTNTDAK